MQINRFKLPTIVLSATLLVIGVSSGAVAAQLITGKDVKDGSLTTSDIKNGTLTTQDLKNGAVSIDKLKADAVGTDKIKTGAVGHHKLKANAVDSSKIKDGSVGTHDLADGSVTANKLAPGAVAFPQTLWGPMIRNQVGAARSTLATGPGTPPMGSGSLHLSVTGTPDRAAFGDSIDFAGVPLSGITGLGYASYNPDAVPAVRPSLRIEINPHLVNDATFGGVFEFSTLTYEPDPGATGWVTHANIQNDNNWYLSGDAATATGCVNTPAGLCTLTEVRDRLDASGDPDTAPPAISTGVYFSLGSGIAATTGAVDKFVFNSFVFDFEPSGVFLTTP